jgi:hypothetical protein
MVGISVEDGFEGGNHPFRLNQVSFRLNPNSIVSL